MAIGRKAQLAQLNSKRAAQEAEQTGREYLQAVRNAEIVNASYSEPEDARTANQYEQLKREEWAKRLKCSELYKKAADLRAKADEFTRRAKRYAERAEEAEKKTKEEEEEARKAHKKAEEARSLLWGFNVE